MDADPKLAKAAKKWARVLPYPCTSGVCQSSPGQLCTFEGGMIRQKPHDQRISAAVKAGACTWNGATMKPAPATHCHGCTLPAPPADGPRMVHPCRDCGSSSPGYCEARPGQDNQLCRADVTRLAPFQSLPLPAQAGTGNAEGSRMEALDDMTDPAGH